MLMHLLSEQILLAADLWKPPVGLVSLVSTCSVCLTVYHFKREIPCDMAVVFSIQACTKLDFERSSYVCLRILKTSL